MQFKHIIWNLAKKEIDMVNVLINIVEMYARFDVGHTIDYNSPAYVLDLTYHDLASTLGYTSLDDKVVTEINSTLDNLAKTHATIYYFDGSDRYMENTTFLLKYILSSTDFGAKRDLDKRFSIMLSTSLIRILRENKDLFKRFYTHDRYDLRGKYSTVLYDTFVKKTRGSTVVSVTMTLDDIIEIVDFDLGETSNTGGWTKINSNILKRASKEIIEKTTMYFSYEKIKNKPSDVGARKQTTAIKFEISLAPEMEETPEYFTEAELMERKIQYKIEMEINRKISELRKFNDVKIKNEEWYRHNARQELLKVKPEYKSKVKIQDLVNWVKYNNPGEHGLVCFYNINGHEVVTVNCDHKLVDVETKKYLTKNAIETLDIIEPIIMNGEEYGLYDIEYKKEYSISYSKG